MGGSHSIDTEPTRLANPLADLPVHLQEIGKECSVIAISNLFGVMKRNVLNKIRSSKKEHLFLSVEPITSVGVLDLMKLYGVSKVDMRLLNNKYRINTPYIPFPTNAKGIVALKFRGNRDTHWVSYSNNQIKDADQTFTFIADIEKAHPTFDGFGHCVISYTPDNHEEVLLESIYSQACSSKDRCNQCIRAKYCFEKPEIARKGKRLGRRMDG